MTDMSISPVVHNDVDPRTGGGHVAPGTADWLCLAAAPTFAIMALWTGFFRGQPDVLCTAMQGSSPMSGMTLMYALMSVFHAAPWLRLISGRRAGLGVVQAFIPMALTVFSSPPRTEYRCGIGRKSAD